MPSAFKSLGTSGNSQWGRMNYVDPDAEFRGAAAIRVYDEMRYTDPTGSMMYQMLSLPIRQVAWRCEAGGDKTPADEEAAAFVWNCLNDMTHSFSETLENVCSMFAYGWAWLEMVLKRRADGRVGFERISLRPQRSFYDWVFADDGDIKGMIQFLASGGQAEIPLARSLLFRTSAEGDIPEGVSMFRAAARTWRFRRRLERTESVGLHRRWAGFPQVELPQDATTREMAGAASDEAKAEDLIKAIYEDRMMGFFAPSGWSLSLGGPQGTIDDTMNATIMRKDMEMSRSILAQFLLVGLKSVGTQSLAETLYGMFTLALEAYLANIAGEFNRYAIPYLLRYNQDVLARTTGLPRLRYSSPRQLDLDVVSKFISLLCRVNMLTPSRETESFLRSLLPGMPEPPVEEPEAEDDEEEPETSAGRRGLERFAVGAAVDSRPGEYHAIADANAAAQVENLRSWGEGAAEKIAGLNEYTTEHELRAKIDDLILVGLLLFRERSVLDIGAAFWLGFGKSSGGPVELQVLSEEVALADRWIGYAEPGTLVRTNPAGKPTLFGDIAGTLEGRIAAILLLLKQGRREELMLEVQNAVKAATRSYARGGQYAGHVWRAIWQGAAQRLGPIGRQTRPVRWVLDPVAEHCRQCQEFGADPPGRTYPSWDALLSFTGGILPGFGTDCNGNCRCHVEVENGDVWGWL